MTFPLPTFHFPQLFPPLFFVFVFYFMSHTPWLSHLLFPFSFFFFIFICLFFFLHHFVSHTPWLPLLFFLPPLSFAFFFCFFVHWRTSCLKLFFFFFFFFLIFSWQHPLLTQNWKPSLSVSLSLCHKQLSLSQLPTPPNAATVAASSPFAAASLPLLHGLTSSNLNLR